MYNCCFISKTEVGKILTGNLHILPFSDPGMGYLLFQFVGQSSECIFIEIIFAIIARIFTVLTDMHRKTFSKVTKTCRSSC